MSGMRIVVGMVTVVVGLLLGVVYLEMGARASSRVSLERVQRGSDAVLIVRDAGDKIIGVVSACR